MRQLLRKYRHGDIGATLIASTLALTVVFHLLPIAVLIAGDPTGAVEVTLLSLPLVGSAAAVGLLLSLHARVSLVQEAVDATQSAFVVYDGSDRLVMSNRRYREALGLPDAAFAPGTPYENLVRRSLAKAGFDDGAEDEELRRRLRLHRVADGVPSDRLYPGNRWLRVTKTRTARGANVGIAVDVTEYYDLMARLETEAGRFAALAHSAPVAICQVAASGRMRFANTAFLAMFGARTLAELEAHPARLVALHEALARIADDSETELVAGVEPRDFMVRKSLVRIGARPGVDGRPEAGEHIYIFVDITERKKAAARMRHLALHDALTGALNRVAFADDLDAAVLCAGADAPAALMVIDLDRFKPVNDGYGHLVGDELLRQVVGRVGAVLPQGFRLYRTGGDEFCVLATRAVRPRVAEVAEAVLRRVAAPFAVFGQHVQIGASIGVSFLPDDAPTADALVHFADLAMYRVKDGGGGGVRMFHKEILSSANSRQLLEADFAAALQERELVLHYQPIVCGDGAYVLAVEALVRWRNRRTGQMIPPAEFVPIAEENGLVQAMDMQVFDVAVGQLAAWTAAGAAPDILAVNMSARTLEAVDTVACVVEVLAQHGVDGRRVVIELAESFAERNPAELCSTLRRLAAHGLRFAIDDFGTGYTSFRLLADLPIDFIKIDRSFVADLASPAPARSRAIVRAIVNVAHELRLGVIAVGVETEAQRQVLVAMDCGLFQGHHFGRPAPAAAVTEMLARRNGVGGAPPQAAATARRLA